VSIHLYYTQNPKSLLKPVLKGRFFFMKEIPVCFSIEDELFEKSHQELL